MKRLSLFLLLTTLLAGPSQAQQDQVTIPRSRLEELERKEAELEKLKGRTTNTQPVAASSAAAAAQPAAAPAAVRVPEAAAYVAPALESLPPLREGETVQALDLAAHYEQNKLAADQRYLKRSFVLQGTVERFQKRLFGRYYDIVLDTGAIKVTLICEVFPPPRFTAAIISSGGTEVYGASGNSRIPIAKAGNMVTVRGQCRGLEKDGLVMRGCELKTVSAGNS